MAPKKKNGFFYYMLEEKIRKEKRGPKTHMKSIAKDCSEAWKNLSAEKKLLYENMAKTNNNQSEKYTSQNVPISMIAAQKEAAIEKENNKKQKVFEIIDLATNLQNQNFFFISVNYFCKNSDGSFIPAEVGMIKYNLQNGVVDSMNIILDVDKLPLGMKFTVQDYSEKTHKIQIQNGGEKNRNEIFKKIFDFSYDSKLGCASPLITNKENIIMVEEILKALCWDSDNDENTFTVLSLTEVFFSLKKTTAKSLFNAIDFPSIHIAQAHIDRDVYMFKFLGGCIFHDEIDNHKYCTISTVKRWAYTISDHCCLDLGITMIPGQHVPINCDIAKNSVKFEIGDTESVASETFSIPINIKPNLDAFNTIQSRDNLLNTYRDQDNDSPASFYNGLGRGSLLRRSKSITPETSSLAYNAQHAHLLSSYREQYNDTPNSVYDAGRGRVSLKQNYFAAEYSNTGERLKDSDSAKDDQKLKKLFG